MRTRALFIVWGTKHRTEGGGVVAVWSIGVRYGGVQNVVKRYQTASAENGLDGNAHTVSDMRSFLGREGRTAQELADAVFANRQRTSSRGGILKAQAVLHFADVLHSHGIQTLADVPKVVWYEELAAVERSSFAQAVYRIPGQRSGISFVYFLMLCGSSGIVKPDRMVHVFLKDTLGRSVSAGEAQTLISHASRILNKYYGSLTPRSLDNIIWKHQSGR